MTRHRLVDVKWQCVHCGMRHHWKWQWWDCLRGGRCSMYCDGGCGKHTDGRHDKLMRFYPDKKYATLRPRKGRNGRR